MTEVNPPALFPYLLMGNHQGEGSALGPSSQITARLGLQGEENSFGCPDFVRSSLSLHFCPFGFSPWVQARLHPTGNAALGSHAGQKSTVRKGKAGGEQSQRASPVSTSKNHSKTCN